MPSDWTSASGASGEVWSVGEFTRELKAVLESSFGRVRVRGQISNLARPQSGHLYFSLVDDGGARGGSRFSSAQLPVVMWRSSVSRIRHRPENGDRVVVSGRLAVYEPRGVYQLVADRIEPEGVGDLQQAFDRLKEKLAAEGLFEASRKRPLPFLPRCIGLVTSPSGAAVRDFLRVASQRFPGFWVRLRPVRVQGEGAAEEIAAAVDAFGAHPDGVEVVVLTRGGGSLEDLWAFNEEVVARALARCPLPTVSAVGHEVDFSIADFVADARAPTPTGAASLVLPDVAALRAQLRAARTRLAMGLRGVAERGELRLARVASSRYFREPQLLVEERFAFLDEARGGLENHLYKRLGEWEDSLAHLATKLDDLGPYAVLRRGYSLALDGRGSPIRSADELEPGQKIRLRFSEGRADATIDSVSASSTDESREDRGSEAAPLTGSATRKRGRPRGAAREADEN